MASIGEEEWLAILGPEFVSLFVYLFLPTRSWRTRGPFVTILVTEDSKCSSKRPGLLCFSIQ